MLSDNKYVDTVVLKESKVFKSEMFAYVMWFPFTVNKNLFHWEYPSIIGLI